MTSSFETELYVQPRPAILTPYHQPTAWDSVQRFGCGFQPGSRKSSRQIISQANVFEQTRPYQDSLAQLRTLQQYYTMVDSDRDIIELLEERPTLFPLLMGATQPLQAAFGEERIFHVRVQYSDEDSLLKVAVQLPADFAQPETALQSFDTTWWVNNCQRSGGMLVFDYEIQDAV